METYTSHDEENGFLVDSIYYSYNPDEKWNAIKYEKVSDCVNEFVAKEIMKDEMIGLENETRASNEVIEDILNKTNSYTIGDIPFYSYDKVINSLTSYDNSLVDECYYNEHFFIARSDKKILISYMQNEDNYIDNVISHYFNKI